MGKAKASKYLPRLKEALYYEERRCRINAMYSVFSIEDTEVSEIIHYVENKTGIKAILSNNGENAPYNGTSTYSLDIQKAEKIGFELN